MGERITVIGSSNVDMIMKLERLPQAGETVTGGAFLQVFGGKGANQAVAAARAGGKVTFLSAVGEDDFGRAAVANFQQDGIATEYIVSVSGIPTGCALILIDAQGENSIAVAPGANYALLPEHIEANADVIRDSAMIVMQREIPTPTILRALELAAEFGTPVLFNYAPAQNREVLVSAQMTGLVVNEIEAAMLSGLPVETKEEAATAGEALRRQGPSFVVVTLGAEGAVVVSATGKERVPAFPVTPVDTTAAGDVFCGALAVALVEGNSLPDAVRFASAASAISVTRLGAQPSIPHRQEIEALVTPND